MKRAVVLLTLMIGVAGCGEPGSGTRGRLLDANGQAGLELELVVVETELAREEGLRSFGPLGPDQGLLLSFPRTGDVCISNRGVGFPIDVVYLSATRQVIGTERNIPAEAQGPFCHGGAQMVLELRGGTLGALNYSKLELL
jgi:uncharacterized membrane protein (UPF0127 family)